MDLVTGACGHIGNVLVRTLTGRGRNVRALALPGEDTRSLSGLPVEIMEGDVTHPASLEKAFCGVERVFHLAGLISILPGRQDLVRRVNLDGTLNVIAAARRCGVQRLVYTSSIHALRREPEGVMVDEDTPFDPHNAIGEYDRSKAAASLAVQEAARSGLNAVLALPTGVIGPFDYRLSEMGHLIWEWMRSRVHFLVDGRFDFVDVRDVAEGLALAGERGQSGQAYILSGTQVDLPALKALTQTAAGVKSPSVMIPGGLAKIAAWFTPLFYRLTNSRPRFTSYSLATVFGASTYSRARAERDLGYAPRPLEETMRDTVTWFQEQPF